MPRVRTPARPVHVLVVGLLVAASSALAPAAAVAAEEEGLIRLAHLSPDTPAGDVYVDSVSDPDVQLTFPGVEYGMVSDYQEVPAGTYTISMLPVGSPPDAQPILSATVDVAPGSARTVAGLGHFADLGLDVLEVHFARGELLVRLSGRTSAPSPWPTWSGSWSGAGSTCSAATAAPSSPGTRAAAGG